MKTKYLTTLVIILLFPLFGNAITQNKLTIPTVEGGLGKDVTIPVSLTNDSGIVAAQFKLHFPTGCSVNTTSAALSVRKDDHTLSVKNLGNNDYLFVIFSATNKPLKSNSGILLQLNVTIPQTWKLDSVYAMSFKQLILSASNGRNLATTSEAGAIKVTNDPRPDIMVQNITCATSAWKPGQKFTISWQVKNIGTKATEGEWSEQIIAVDANGNEAILGNASVQDILQAGATVNRQTEVTIPDYSGIDGTVRLKVKLLPSESLGELIGASGNNTTTSTGTFQLSKNLSLNISERALLETVKTPINCFLYRSGNRTADQTFTLRCNQNNRISFPATLNIKAGESGAFFTIQSTDNAVLDADSTCILYATNADYSEVADTLIIFDNELPKISVSISKTVLAENETATLLVERPVANSKSLIVNLSNSQSKRLNLPNSLTIPANQKSVSFSLMSVDDNVPALPVDASIIASATGFATDTATLTLTDNDMPQLALTFSPYSVSESAGTQASVVTVKRSSVTNNALTVKISDNAAGALFYSNATLSFAAGETEKQITLGVVDNAQMEGARTFAVNASVFMASCGCSAESQGVGLVSGNLTVLDDDGPALKITSTETMLPEGRTQATMLTITRNTPTAQALAFTLISDKESMLTYQNTASIPAGSTSAIIPVDVKSNSTTEGNQTVTFTASARGFTNGVCWAMITDQTLPDATVTVLSASPSTGTVKATAQVELLVKNAGVSSLVSSTPVNVYLCNTTALSTSTTKQLLLTTYTTAQIAPNGNETSYVSVTLPNLTGTYYLIASINEDKAVNELSTLNNTSNALPIEIEPAYTIELHTDKTKYKTGEQIVFSGKAVSNGSGSIAEVPVEIYMITNGFRHTVTTTTDASGNFSLNYTPYQGQMGHFSAGACYPGQGLTEEKIALDIYGLSRTSSENIIWDVVATELRTGEIEILNEGNLSITGLKCSVVSCPSGVQLTFDPLSSIAAGGTTKIKYYLTGTIVSTANQYEKIKFQITSNEGAALDIMTYYYCRSQNALLKGSVPAIETTMAKGVNRTFEYILTNIGKGASGKINIAIPSNTWLKLITPSEIPSLASGASATIVFEFSPTNDMPANVPVTGNIGINCENGNGIALPYRIETVSEKTGTLKIDVCDEYTYNTQAAPHLSGAVVKVKHPFTGAIIAEGVTGTDGIFLIPNLPEGYYTVAVTAPKHGNYQNEVYVEAGKTKAIEVFIQFQAITYSWDVIPTTFDDKYNVNLVTKFETYVPIPVILIDMPKKFPALSVNEEFAFIVTLTNTGLITAKNVELNFPNHPSYDFVTSYKPTDIGSYSSISVFVTMRNKMRTIQKSKNVESREVISALGELGGAISDVTDVFCNVYTLVADYFYLCGNRELKKAAVTAMNIDAIDFICNGFQITIPLHENTNTPVPNNQPGGSHELQGPWENGNYNPDCLLYTLCPGLKRDPLSAKVFMKAKGSAETEKTVCASVSLKFSQSVSITREAFEGTLKINNGVETGEMKNVKLDLEIKDEDGIVRNDLFQINTLSLDQITGIDGNGVIEALKTGTAVIQFIPEKGAAPVISKAYSFGGTLSYLDPSTSVLVTTKLLPVTLTVKPCPDLYLNYFIQRDVLGDDPLTAAVETIEPAELSLLIYNKGAGDATKVVLDSEQPKIIENEKGLNIDFKMIGSSLNGNATSMGMTRVDFGNIPAGKTGLGQWWFTSSLLGHFSEYKAELTHLTSFDNPDLSLISDVSIHELIRSVEAKTVTNETVTAFITNDIPDNDDQPDMLYLADGTTERVFAASSVNMVKTSDNVYTLTITPSTTGYNYGSITDPTNGRAKLVSIKRTSDNATLSLRNFWQTDRTLIDKKEPVYEYKLHFVDKFMASAGSYILTFEPKPLKMLEVQSYENAPAAAISSPVQSINVVFNKDIDASSFGVDDISLKCAGTTLDLGGKLSITKILDSKYKLDISKLTSANGYYELTVHAKNITDLENYQGENGKQIGWTQNPTVVQFTLQVNPANSGTLNYALGSKITNFNAEVALTAMPATGYKFVNWTVNDNETYTESSRAFIADAAKKITANFELIDCLVEIVNDDNVGTLNGTKSAIYKYNSYLELTAVPIKDYKFTGWTINNTYIGANKTYTMIVKNDMKIIPAYSPLHSIIYRTKNDNDWSSNEKWQFSADNGITWVNNESEPELNIKSVIIQNETQLPLSKTINVDNLIVNSNSKFETNGIVNCVEKIIIISDDTSTGQLLNNGQIEQGQNARLVFRKDFKASKGWYFVSFPYDVRLQDIQIPSSQFQAVLGNFKTASLPYNDLYIAEYDGKLRDQTGTAKATDSPNWIPVMAGYLKAGKGYAMIVMNDQTFDFISESGNNKMFDKTDKVVELDLNQSNQLLVHRNWNLVGVPYTSSFNFDKLDQGSFYYVYDNIKNTYDPKEHGDGFEINPFEAFFMQASNEKLNFSVLGRVLKSPKLNQMKFEEISLSISNNQFSDRTRIRLRDDATTNFELDKDAVKMLSLNSLVPQIWSKSLSYDLAVNSLPLNVAEVPLSLKIGIAGSYKISLDKVESLSEFSKIVLVDYEKKVEMDLLSSDIYSFDIKAGTYLSRFKIKFIKDVTTQSFDVFDSDIKINVQDNVVTIQGLINQAQVTLYDVTGREVQRFENVLNNERLTLKSFAGIFTIYVRSNTQESRMKVMLR